jgi:hypothetical protein
MAKLAFASFLSIEAKLDVLVEPHMRLKRIIMD